jgi:hypothetical protein
LEKKAMLLFEDKDSKIVKSPSYNFYFRKSDGFFARWGKTKEEDPNFSPYGSEILDIEVTTICDGVKQVDGKEAPCRFCYKSNTSNGKNMSFETFKSVIDKFPKVDEHWVLTQIAFGADSHATSNPDLWKMMKYSRSIGIIPNITVADISDETADNLAKYCGAVAVSRYANKDLCYDSVKRLTDRGMTQVNIHILVSSETEEMVWETLRDRLADPRLAKLNAIVLLSLKKKGRGRTFTQLPFENFQKIVRFALENKIGVGFDSCSCPKFLASVQDRPDYAKLSMVSEPCESSCFSFFINVEGKGFPCSFAEKTEGWEEGMDIIDSKDFIRDVWNNERMVSFRDSLLRCHRNCPLYQI